MRILLIAVAVMSVALAARADLWPFGSSDEKEPPRLSELMEPASELIDVASDLAFEGKVSEAIEKYREALKKLDQIEAENPERAKKPEFATLRNKRAYVSAAIDSMLLSQIKNNAKAVAVSDTTELEKKLAAERNANVKRESAEKMKLKNPRQNHTRKDRFMRALARNDEAEAEKILGEMLAANSKSPTAFCLKAMLERRRGDVAAAEKTLDECIMANPSSHFAYYNMARLKLEKGEIDEARRYYETGRSAGGPEDSKLKEKLK